jgi:hypothetical protein
MNIQKNYITSVTSQHYVRNPIINRLFPFKRSLLRHYATNGKFAGTIQHEVIGFLNRLTPSSRTITLVSIQPLTEMITRNLPAG